MEEPIQFKIGNKRLYGIIHIPSDLKDDGILVLFIIGGPQTRVGSHRLYVQLARYLENRGIQSFRFDYEGLGDSEDSFVGFRHLLPSINAVLNFLSKKLPHINNIIIWSLCDGATASLVFSDEIISDNISGMILCNPYLETEKERAKVMLKYYYLKRLIDINFWIKVVTLKYNLSDSIKSFRNSIIKSFFKNDTNNGESNSKDFYLKGNSLTLRVVEGIKQFKKPLTFMLSSNDFAAREFEKVLLDKKDELIDKNIQIINIENADHTFSNQKSKKEVFIKTAYEVEKINKIVRSKVL